MLVPVALIIALIPVAGCKKQESSVPPAATAPTVATSWKTPAIDLPPGMPPVEGVMETAFYLRDQEIKIGEGAEAEPNRMYKVHYTGWLAADGRKFDSSYD